MTGPVVARKGVEV